MLDHGYEVDENTRCRSRTKKSQQCSHRAIKGIELCALHSGLAKAKGKPGYGDQRRLDDYKKKVARVGSGRARG